MSWPRRGDRWAVGGCCPDDGRKDYRHENGFCSGVIEPPTRRPQYRVLAALLRRVTAELMLKDLDERGIRVSGTSARRTRLVNRVLPVVDKLNALGIGLGNRRKSI